MKVRIQGNSIRYRLKQYEVERFKQNREIKELLQLGLEPADSLQFGLALSSDNHFSIIYSSNALTIKVPAAIATDWTDTNTVGFEKKIDTGNGNIVKILVEKDFKCLDGSEEDNIGSYPNPLKNC